MSTAAAGPASPTPFLPWDFPDPPGLLAQCPAWIRGPQVHSEDPGVMGCRWLPQRRVVCEAPRVHAPCCGWQRGPATCCRQMAELKGSEGGSQKIGNSRIESLPEITAFFPGRVRVLLPPGCSSWVALGRIWQSRGKPAGGDPPPCGDRVCWSHEVMLVMPRAWLYRRAPVRFSWQMGDTSTAREFSGRISPSACQAGNGSGWCWTGRSEK